ncbi:MAG: hypothetical protein U1G07_12590 [Verrucomicrobiota bacterium]
MADSTEARVIEHGGPAADGLLFFTPDSRTLVAAYPPDDIIEYWDAATGRRTALLRVKRRPDEQLFAVSPDAMIMASANTGPPGPVILWDVASQRRSKVFAETAAGIVAIAFSPDRTTLATGTMDGLLRLWNLASGSEVATFSAHQSTCRSISFSPDGRYLVTAGVDDTIKLWPAPTFAETDADLPPTRRP